MACLWLAVLSVSAYFGVEKFLWNAFAGLLVPFVQETLFRGFLWGAIEDAWEKSDGEGGRKSGTLAAFISTTLLYALWSLGASVLSSGAGAPQDSRLLMTMCSRALIGMGLGLAAGTARAWTKSFWLSFFLHGIWAILAR